MVYLEYELKTKQVIKIHDEKPNNISESHAIAQSQNFKPNDEFENTIWVNEVFLDENTGDWYVSSHSAIKNNPNANRLLQENKEIKDLLKSAQEAIDFLIMGGGL